MDSFEEIEDMIIEEEQLMLEYLNPTGRKQKVIKPRPNHFCEWDDEDFRKRFRLQKNSVVFLLSQLAIEHESSRNQSIPAMLQLLIALRFYATGSFYITVGDFSGVHKSTVCKIVNRVTTAIAALRPLFIKVPNTPQEIFDVQERFYSIARFPRTIAAIDCSHIRIQSPGGTQAETFRNRKGFFSINVQALCDANLSFIDIVARWPGSTHDSRILANSRIKYLFESGNFGNGVMVGDSGYPSNAYTLTPLTDPRSNAEKLYNESQIRTRNVIERCFGVWKRRFPVLSIGMRCRIPLTQDVIVATAILHNIARKNNEDEPPEDSTVVIEPETLFEDIDTDAVNLEYTRNSFIEYFGSLQ